MVPEISIGLPVFNGEKYLHGAMDSLLAQTFENFELVISDNCSTDATQDICLDYARRDRRICYYRGESNIGAAGNFNRVFELTRGELFKWAAHDDFCAPEYLAECVQVMRDRPNASLCQSEVVFVDQAGRAFGHWPCTAGTDHAQPHRRLQAVFGDVMCLEIFGVMRRRAMGAMPVMGSFAHGDGVLLARLALAGPFHALDEPLFFSRRHADQSASVNKNAWEWAAWFDPSNNGHLVMPYWRIYGEYFKAVRRSQLSLREQALCLGHWLRAAASDRRRLCQEVLLAARHFFGRQRKSAVRRKTPRSSSEEASSGDGYALIASSDLAPEADDACACTFAERNLS